MVREKNEGQGPERCQALFYRARLLSGARRLALLDEIGQESASLRARIEALLQADAAAGDFLEPADRSKSKDEIPGYRLIEIIGEGGFGAVWRAEQQQPIQRNVAIKILQPGAASDDFLLRFEAERQALALMDHPGIATIFDAGTTALDRPWFAMELVDGASITEYCDKHELSVSERLELFELTCEAVHHAHQRGVIHRDLKPNNVLVAEHSSGPTPKVIDFGIAKAIDGQLSRDSVKTRAQQLLGTPRYMSPEQASSEMDIDTRTDVYSLGVLLYELLIGTTPLGPEVENLSLAGVLRTIREEEPLPPSSWLENAGLDSSEIARVRRTNRKSLARTLRNELDWIVLKSINRERTQRYSSAADLGRDVRRYLDGEPVEAHPPRWPYKLSKFVRRNRVAVGAAAVIFLSLLVGVIVSSMALRDAGRQREVARSALADEREQVWQSELSRAREAQSTKSPGRRDALLGAVTNAVQIRSSHELRELALAGHVLPDVELVRTENIGLDSSGHGLRVLDRYAVTPERGVVLVRSIDGSRDIARLRGPDLDAYDMTFSPEGQYVAAKFEGAEGERRRLVWHVPTGRVILDAEAGTAPISVVFDRRVGTEPRWLAFPAIDGGIRVLELPGLRLLRTLGDTVDWWALTSGPAGERLVATSLENRQLKSWSLRDGASLLDVQTPTAFRCIAWSALGNLLAAGGTDHRGYLLDADSGQLTAILAGHDAPVVETFFGAADGVLATAAWDGTTRLWNSDTGELLLGPIDSEAVGFKGEQLITKIGKEFRTLSFGSLSGLAAYRADEPFGTAARMAADRAGHRLITGGANGVLLWDTERKSRPLSLSLERAVGLHWLPDDATIIGVFENQVRYWKVTDRVQPLEVVEEGTLWSGPNIVRASGLIKNSSEIALIVDEEILFVDVRNGDIVRRLDGFAGASRPLSTHPSQRWLAVGNWKGKAAHVVDLRDGQVVREFPGTNVALRFGPAGERMAMIDGHTLELLSAPGWVSSSKISRKNANNIAGFIEFSPDGSMVVAKHAMNSIRLFRATDGQTIATLNNSLDQGIVRATYSGDGRRLAAVTAERTMFVWDLDRIDRHLASMELEPIE